ADTADRIAAGMSAAVAMPDGAEGAEAAEGAEGEAGVPLRPSRLADLAWLGIDAVTIERLAPWVDLLPVATPVNVNTAPREVLVAAIDGLDLGTAERLVQQRQRKPFASIAEVKAQLGEGITLDAARVSVNSRFFEVAGRLRLEERVLEERSLLERQPGGRTGNIVVVRREKVSYETALR
ncbi:MAG TPA: type II secretion system protein GspK, partial [Rubrivivax sp.]|nr:type II secretion system protein GspK [Rubrivivax sp.]